MRYRCFRWPHTKHRRPCRNKHAVNKEIAENKQDKEYSAITVRKTLKDLVKGRNIEFYFQSSLEIASVISKFGISELCDTPLLSNAKVIRKTKDFWDR